MIPIYFFFVLLNIFFTSGTQTIDVKQEICVDNNECEQTDTIHVTSEVEQCTPQLMFQYGDDKTAYLSQDGTISSNRTEGICNKGFKSLKYALQNMIIEVIKHKNSVFVKNITSIDKKLKAIESAGLFQFYKEHVHDLYQDLFFLSVIICGLLCFVYNKICKNLCNCPEITTCLPTIKSEDRKNCASKQSHQSSENPKPYVERTPVQPAASRPPPSAPLQSGWLENQDVQQTRYGGFLQPQPRQGQDQQPQVFNFATPAFATRSNYSDLRAAQSISSIYPQVQMNTITETQRSQSVTNVSQSGRVPGRSYEQRKQSDKVCVKCEKWFKPGQHFNTHIRVNTNNNNDKCVS